MRTSLEHSDHYDEDLREMTLRDYQFAADSQASILGYCLDNRLPGGWRTMRKAIAVDRSHDINNPFSWAHVHEIIANCKDVTDEDSAKEFLAEWLEEHCRPSRTKHFMSKHEAERLLAEMQSFSFFFNDDTLKEFVIDRMLVVNGFKLFDLYPEFKAKVIPPQSEDDFTVLVYYHLPIKDNVKIKFMDILPYLQNRIEWSWIVRADRP